MKTSLTFFLAAWLFLPLQSQAMPSDKAILSRDEAELRAGQISNVKYNLQFTLPESAPDFSGKVILSFDWKVNNKALRIDFSEGEIRSIKVNGAEVPSNHKDHESLYLTLDAKYFKNGRNLVEIEFSHPYSIDGAGLYHFTDPEDQKVYTYSNLEPYDANRVFPCFDQPDLKATYKMAVTAPKSWTVITSVREDSKSLQAENQLWEFPESAQFSTYIWSLHAGPYHSWKSTAGSIPLRLFVRESMAKYVRPDDWFTWTKQGLAFYQKYFNFKYPYKKYDQIIVPDFNAGAMENVAAVTFTENYLSRGHYTHANRQRNANTLLHEMAHMWFGDLVTMKWWNDLWLNESFATYMSSLTMSKATEFKKEAWRQFATSKMGAYRTDQSVITHPIEASVTNTAEAFANFDAITYGKGASLQKQLSFYLGADKYQKGVQQYFQTFAGKNTQLIDFIGSLSQASQQDLREWTETWLRTAGLNSVQAEFQCVKQKVSQMKLLQSAPKDHPTLRRQKTRVAFLRLKNSKLMVDKVLDVMIAGETTSVPRAQGLDCPDAIYPNYEDDAYVKVLLDPASLQSVQANLQNVQDPFLRQMFWSSIWDMVRDARMSVKTYAEMVLKILPEEPDERIVMQVLGTFAGSRFSNVYFYYPHESRSEKIEYAHFTEQAEKVFFSALTKAKPESDLQRFWYDVLANNAESEFALQKLADLLDGKIQIPGLTIDQDMRWQMICQLSANNMSNPLERVRKEQLQDKSSTGQLSALGCEVSIPSAKNKEEWLKKANDPKSFPNIKTAQAVLSNLYPRNQENELEKYSNKFFDNLSKLSKTEGQMYLLAYAWLAPRECDEGSKDQLGNYLEANKNLKPALAKELKIVRQEGQICRKIRALAREDKK